MKVSVLTGTTAPNATALFTATKPCKIVDFRVHLSTTGSNNLSVIVDANRGAAYDTTIATISMAVTDYVMPKTNLPIYLEKGDVVKLTWVSGGTLTYAFMLMTEDVG